MPVWYIVTFPKKKVDFSSGEDDGEGVIGKEEVEIVPLPWFTSDADGKEQHMIRWPQAPARKLPKLQEQCATPQEDWSYVEYSRILSQAESYPEALAKADIAEMTSDIDAEYAEQNDKRTRYVRHRKTVSEDEEELHESDADDSPPPKKKRLSIGSIPISNRLKFGDVKQEKNCKTVDAVDEMRMSSQFKQMSNRMDGDFSLEEDSNGRESRQSRDSGLSDHSTRGRACGQAQQLLENGISMVIDNSDDDGERSNQANDQGELQKGTTFDASPEASSGKNLPSGISARSNLRIIDDRVLPKKDALLLFSKVVGREDSNNVAKQLLALNQDQRFLNSYVLQLKVMREISEMKEIMGDLAKKLEKISLARANDPNEEIDGAGERFPFDNYDEFISFCKTLETNSHLRKNVKIFLRRYGGTDGAKTVSFLMRKIMLDRLAVRFNKKGKGGLKTAFRNQSVYSIVCELAQEQEAKFNLERADQMIGDWLKGAQHRIDPRGKKGNSGSSATEPAAS